MSDPPAAPPRALPKARVPPRPPIRDAKAPEAPAKPSDTTAKPSDTTAKPSDTTAKPSDTTAKPSDTTAKPSEDAAKPSDTTAKPSEDAAKPSEDASEASPGPLDTELREHADTLSPPAPQSGSSKRRTLGSPETLEGVTLGRYVLRHLIAQGGMASVYLSQQVGDDGFARWAAIKIMHPHLARDARFVAMFLDEARITSRIVHPNVCAVTDYGKGPPPHLVMEHLHGEPLGTLVKAATSHGGVPVWLALRVIADAARGLHAAHEARSADGERLEIVHRDVSMQNVFVLYDGVTKVLDFGVAKARQRLSGTETGELKGKIAYMAPDVLAGAPADRRADVWGLGVVLWELLANRRLFRGANEASTVHNVLHGAIPSLAGMRRDVPASLDALVARALDREPSRRLQTAAQLADLAEEQLRTLGTSANAAQVAEWMGVALAERKREREALVRALSDDPSARVEALQRDEGWFESSDAREIAVGARVAPPSRRPTLVGVAVVALCLLVAISLGWQLAGSPLTSSETTAAALVPPTAPVPDTVSQPAPPVIDETASAHTVAEEIGAEAVERGTTVTVAPAVVETPPTTSAETHGRRERRSEEGRSSGAEVARPPTTGTLNLMAIPPAEVSLGARTLGRTPLVNVALPVGRHTLTLRPIGGGASRTTTITIRPGERTLESVRMQ